MENSNKGMTLNEYQERAMSTCMDSCDNLTYMLVNLVAEVGEFSGKIAKAIRRSEVCIRDNQLTADNLFDKENLEKFANLKAELILEAGDILWQLSGVLHTIGFTLEDAGSINLDKLSSRAKRGKIDGDGDHR